MYIVYEYSRKSILNYLYVYAMKRLCARGVLRNGAYRSASPTQSHIALLICVFFYKFPQRNIPQRHAAKAIRLVAFINIFRTYYYTLIKYISYGARGVDGPPHGIL